MKQLMTLTTLAMVLALSVVMLGAYTRLTDAGLGCPDWPLCYGHVMPEASLGASGQKAWTEMAHRYLAGTLGLLIISIGSVAGFCRLKKQTLPWKLPLALTLLVFFQAALGMWTVTLKLLPVVVMAHLLGGILIFGGLCYFRLQLGGKKGALRQNHWITLGALLVLCQVALGGWVSANYAGLACIGFPTCQGQWWPTLDFSKGFYLFSPVGDNYQGGILEHQVRLTIQWVHRLGALVVFLYVTSLSWIIYVKERSPVAILAAFLVLLQCVLGILNVVYLLPLWVAVLHNGVAALLFATMLSMVYLEGVPNARRC